LFLVVVLVACSGKVVFALEEALMIRKSREKYGGIISEPSRKGDYGKMEQQKL
jgi:hypothetical protein